MNEKLLQSLWNFKLFNRFDFSDTEGHPLEILDFGKWNHDSGPDFLFAKIKIDGIVLVGHIELHVRASDWIFHRHSGNPEFDNIILHAVYTNDAEIDELKTKNVRTLELMPYIDSSVLSKYAVMAEESTFIPSEKIFDVLKVPFNYWEETLLKKLDAKSVEIEASLAEYGNNYEAVLFQYLAYAFGLKINAPIFKSMAEQLDFSVVYKVRQNPLQLEALFFGISGWLNEPLDGQMAVWKREFDFLKAKFRLPNVKFTPKFSKLRPPNFPTVRLSQLANLYHQHQNLFSKLIETNYIEGFYHIFCNVKASEYWDERFSFGKISSVAGPKFLSRDFTDVILMNAVLPILYTYFKNFKEDTVDQIIDLYKALSSEKNTIISNWNTLGVRAESAADSQALLFQYKNYCSTKNCLNCSIGLQLLKADPKP